MHIIRELLRVSLGSLTLLLLALWVLIAIALLLLILKLLKQRSGFGTKHGLLQLHSKTKIEKRDAIDKRLFKDRKKLLVPNVDSSGNAATFAIRETVIDPKLIAKPVVALHFDGDIFASDRKDFAQLVDEVLVNKERIDSAVVVVSSPGGSVAHYGQMFSEMERLRSAGVELTVCVDTTAASGGYLMSLPANKIVAAPYAMVGSIGVVAEFVNGYDFLKEHGLQPVTMTAGKYKRTITPLGEITPEGKQHFQDKLEAIHRLFIDSVKKYRNVDAENVCTGDYWTAKESMDMQLNLVDQLATSQEYLFAINQSKDLVLLSQKKNKFERGFLKMAVHLIETFWARLMNLQMY
jgi:serine protease SohB